MFNHIFSSLIACQAKAIVIGLELIDVIPELRAKMPFLPVFLIAERGRALPASLPAGVVGLEDKLTKMPIDPPVLVRHHHAFLLLAFHLPYSNGLCGLNQKFRFHLDSILYSFLTFFYFLHFSPFFSIFSISLLFFILVLDFFQVFNFYLLSVFIFFIFHFILYSFLEFFLLFLRFFRVQRWDRTIGFSTFTRPARPACPRRRSLPIADFFTWRWGRSPCFGSATMTWSTAHCHCTTPTEVSKLLAQALFHSKCFFRLMLMQRFPSFRNFGRGPVSFIGQYSCYSEEVFRLTILERLYQV